MRHTNNKNESAFRIIPEISKAPVLKGLSEIRLRFLDTQTKRLPPSLLKKIELVGKKIKITYLSQKRETIIVLSSKGVSQIFVTIFKAILQQIYEKDATG